MILLEKMIEDLGGIKVENFNEAIKTADFISIHIPLNNQTKI